MGTFRDLKGHVNQSQQMDFIWIQTNRAQETNDIWEIIGHLVTEPIFSDIQMLVF